MSKVNVIVHEDRNEAGDLNVYTIPNVLIIDVEPNDRPLSFYPLPDNSIDVCVDDLSQVSIAPVTKGSTSYVVNISR